MTHTKLIATLQKISALLNQDPMTLYSMIGPKSLQLEITNACNLRCIMCDRWKWDSSLKGDLTTQDLFTLFDELSSLGTRHILFSGGEPLLRKDFNEIIHRLDELNISTTVITNGVFLTEDIAHTLISTDTTIILSVDGSNEEIYAKIRGRTGLFNTIIGNIEKLVALRNKHKKGFISMHFVIQKYNLTDILDFYELAKSLSVDTISYGIVHGPHILETGVGFTQDDYPFLVEQLKKLIQLKQTEDKTNIELRKEFYAIVNGEITPEMVQSGLLVKKLFEQNPIPCLSLNYWALIDAFGDVYPCCYAYFDNLGFETAQSLRSRLCFGNVHQNKFQEIWDGKKFNSFRKAMNPVNITAYPKVCGNCGSYFFFKEKWDGITHLNDKLNHLYGQIEFTLSSIRDTILNCFTKPIDRAPRAYESELADLIKAIFDY
ncbi:MAG: radical SAM/SPASM domain-containing protein [Candidatus Helarchaeota archaeon]